MRISLYKIRTYVHLDTWSHETKQSQTKPILPKKPLPSKRKSSLNACLAKAYANTPESQKQTQTKPISTTPLTTTKDPETTKWLLKSQRSPITSQ